MKSNRRRILLVFEDAVGITDAYRELFDSLLKRAGITEQNTRVIRRRSYQAFTRKEHLEWRKTRKQPGFNSDELMQQRVRQWVLSCFRDHTPDMVVCFDPALLFLLNSDWAQATLDKLRGGLYIELGVPWVVTLPLTAFHTKAKATDIAKLNQGFIEKGEFNDYKKELDYNDLESDDEDDERDEDDENDKSRLNWHEPIIIPFGKIVLDYDWQKVARILGRIPVDSQYAIASKGE